MNQAADEVLAQINQYGWYVYIVCDPHGFKPNFAYSVGFWHSFRHPEIIIFGLDVDDLHGIINDIGESVKSGLKIVPDKPYAEFLSEYDCVFRAVNKKYYGEYPLVADGFYRGEFPILQCFWPDSHSIFPWEKGFDPTLIESQPLLYLT